MFKFLSILLRYAFYLPFFSIELSSFLFLLLIENISTSSFFVLMGLELIPFKANKFCIVFLLPCIIDFLISSLVILSLTILFISFSSLSMLAYERPLFFCSIDSSNLTRLILRKGVCFTLFLLFVLFFISENIKLSLVDTIFDLFASILLTRALCMFL